MAVVVLAQLRNKLKFFLNTQVNFGRIYKKNTLAQLETGLEGDRLVQYPPV